MKTITLVILVLTLTVAPVYADNQAGENAYMRGDFETALKEWTLSANQGDTSAQTNLGSMYMYGIAVPRDYSEAVKWYRKAADQGEPQAQSNLGSMYFNGLGIAKDYDEALKWTKKSAEQNNPSAIFSLASMYAQGLGVKQNHNQAFQLALKAAKLNDIGGQFMVGQLYASGLGVETNKVRAAAWFNIVGSKRNAPAPADRNLAEQAWKISLSLAETMTEKEINEALKLSIKFGQEMSGSNVKGSGLDLRQVDRMVVSL